MQYTIIKYYKRTLKSIFISKYNYDATLGVFDCKHFLIFVLKRGRLKVTNLVCGFFFFFICGGSSSLYYKHLVKSRKKKKYKFLGCFNFFFNSYRYFLFFNLFRRLGIFSFLGRHCLKRVHSGSGAYKLAITHTSYVLKKPALCWDHFMFFDIFFTNNLKLIYLFLFSSFSTYREQSDFILLSLI